MSDTDQRSSEGSSYSALENKSELYQRLNPQDLGWNLSGNERFGGFIINEDGRVLLREPANHFGGYHWTFAKGGARDYERPIDTALREVLEETGYQPHIVGHLSRSFGGTGSTNYYFLMMHRSNLDGLVISHGWETASLVWAFEDEAKFLIGQSPNLAGRQRDLDTLKEGCKEIRLLAGEFC